MKFSKKVIDEEEVTALVPDSVLSKSQFIRKTYPLPDDGKLDVYIRFDDNCGNGHNTFTITGTEYRKNRLGNLREVSFGCIHSLIKEHAKDVAHLIKWHLTSTDGPLHYLENTAYWASDTDWDGSKKERNFELARASAAGLTLSDEELSADSDLLKHILMNRLTSLMQDFQKDMTSLGFTY